MSERELQGPAQADSAPVPAVATEPPDPEAPPEGGPGDAAAVRSLALAQGHSLRVEGSESRNVLTLVDPGGTAHISISIGPEGIRLDVKGAALSLATTGPLAIEAESVSLHGKNGLTLTTGGDVRIEAEGQLTSSARSQHIRSTRGNVAIKANDDVQLDGERIRLNS